jgi:multiple sugar transport system substrate-binding protein
MTDPSGRGRPLTRRAVLSGGLAAGAGLTLGLSGCSGGEQPRRNPAAGTWRQFAGTTINFISENTAPTAAIAANLRPFTELTGIKVNIITLELTALVQKVALDLASGQSQYHVIYADPYQVLAPYSAGLVDLRELARTSGLPHPEPGFDDFIPTQLKAAGQMVDREKIFALPYDCPTMVWQYRADLFDKYHDRMADDLGFDPTPSDDSTWEQYLAISRWFAKNADEVPYGSGQQAKQHDSLQADFSNLLWAYGADYFENGTELGLYGSKDPGHSILDSEAAGAAAEMYAKIVAAAHPSSVSWDWDGLGAAFRAGQFAMCPNWHEYAASNEQAMPGKVSYARLPKGPARSANIYGGTGIGISANAPENTRYAAWLFCVWATSPKTELANLASKAGGGTPTRTSVYELSQVKEAEHRPSKLPNMLTGPAVQKAWQPDNIGLRPKVPNWNECDTAIYTQLSKMLAGDQKPRDAMINTKQQIDQIIDRGWVAG